MHDTIIVGASAAGLATAASLRAAGKEYRLFDKAPHVGAAWRGHYQRLHLHTTKGLSGLPGFPMPSDFPRYPSREQMIAYLEEYARKLELRPELSVAVKRIRRGTDGWQVETETERLTARNVVIATGNTRVPYQPAWPGQESFQGPVLHSSTYVNGLPFRGQRVLVIGFGNSGGEIAIDLHENEAKAELSVRSAVNVIPRDLFGLPILAVGLAMDLFPPRIADALSAPLLRLSVGNIEKLGFRKLPYGPAVQINRHGKIPLLDIGTMKLIRDGHLKLRPGVERFTRTGVVFSDDAAADFDAVVLATGFRPLVQEFLDCAEVLDEDGTPRTSGREAAPGLYFCGFHVSPTGMLREIAKEAKAIARAIARERR
jgi:cation diffusion facilitator CzcD-associated flavoprotein CzcO